MDNERSILLSSSGSLISGEIDLSRVSKGRTVIGLTISFFFKFGSVSLVFLFIGLMSLLVLNSSGLLTTKLLQHSMLQTSLMMKGSLPNLVSRQSYPLIRLQKSVRVFHCY